MRAYLYLLVFLIIIASATAASIMPVDCNSLEMGKEYAEGSDICLYGVGFAADTTMDLYVTEDQEHYHPNQEYTDLSGSVERVTTNERGILKLWKVWEDVKEGIYDFIADLDLDGKHTQGDIVNDATYDPGQDPSSEGSGSGTGDNKDIEKVPEFGTIAALLILIGAGITIAKRRKQ